MDNSPQYIKMCKEASEIQSYRHIFIDGDYYSHNDHLIIHCDGYNVLSGGDSIIGIKSKDVIWLPRQDQLQEMVNDDSLIILVKKFFNFMLSFEERWLTCDTLEKAWLCFIMKQKCNKIWTGQDWIKENMECESKS